MKTPEVSLDVAFSQLSKRERQVLVALAQGYSNREVATELGVNPKTVDSHRSQVRKKLGLRNNSDFVRYAIKNGLMDVNGKESPTPPPVERFDPQAEQML